MVTDRQHALLARTLIERCGGLAEASAACNTSKGVLSTYQNPDEHSTMSARVMADLEAYCGEPVYSRALFEARPASTLATDVLAEVCDSVETAADLMKQARAAAADGKITPRERAQLLAIAATNLEQAREAFQVIDGGLSKTA